MPALLGGERDPDHVDDAEDRAHRRHRDHQHDEHRNPQHAHTGRTRDDRARGSALAFFIFELRSGALLGGVTLGNIRHGVAQSGHIGYWIGEKYAGQGFMVEAVQLLVAFAFDTLKLHRIEAACIPDNARSVRVLEKAGFRREGLLRSYLRINGVWQDHYLYALIAGDQSAGGTKG